MEEKRIHAKKKVRIKLSALFMLISVILLVLLVVSIATKGFGIGANKDIGKEAVRAKVLAYLNDVLQGQATPEITSVEEKNGLYLVNISIQGQEYDSYATKDGNILFPSAIDISKTSTTQQQPPTQNITKTAVPTVQLFVMSKCPYGVQAENALLPVVKLLKDKINFELHFIANEQGGVFSSLHGQPEVNEDLRQVCAIKYYPATYPDYILCQNKNYESNKDMDTTWKSCLTANSMEISKIESCFNSTEGSDLLKANIKLSNDLSIGSSPTMLINDADYTGGRTSAAMQSTICNAFTTPPSECGQEVQNGSNSTTAGGNC